jgi:hypothetical protein
VRRLLARTPHEPVNNIVTHRHRSSPTARNSSRQIRAFRWWSSQGFGVLVEAIDRAEQLPGGVAGELLRCSVGCRRWEGAELGQHSEHVHDDAAFGELAVSESVDSPCFDRHAAAGRRDSH